MYICLCKDVTDRHIRAVIKSGACTFGEVRKACKVGTQCGKCTRNARDLVQQELGMVQQELKASTRSNEAVFA